MSHYFHILCPYDAENRKKYHAKKKIFLVGREIEEKAAQVGGAVRVQTGPEGPERPADLVAHGVDGQLGGFGDGFVAHPVALAH